MIKTDHLAITKLNPFRGVHGKTSGVQNDRLGRLLKMDATEKNIFQFFTLVFRRTFRYFSRFFKKAKTGDFVLQFSRGKMRRPKKQSTPRRSARKNEENSHLRFFIFETLSQRFLRYIFRDFQQKKRRNRHNSLKLAPINFFQKTDPH